MYLSLNQFALPVFEMRLIDEELGFGSLFNFRTMVYENQNFTNPNVYSIVHLSLADNRERFGKLYSLN